MSLSAPAGQPFQGGNPRRARNFLASVRLNKTAFNLAWLHRCTRRIRRAVPSQGSLAVAHEQAMRTRTEGQIGGHHIDAPTPLTRAGIAFGFPAELEGGSARYPGAIALSKWLLQLAQKPPPTWANGLANSIAISKPTAPLLSGETRRDHTPHSAIIAPLSAAVPEADSSPQPDAKTPLSSLPKQATESRRSLGTSRQKAGNEKAEGWDES